MSSGQDNLEDSVFHGFRSLFGADCIDYPKKESMYKGYIPKADTVVYGRLFTIWRTLEDIVVNRENIIERIKSNDYDLVIFGSIHRSYEIFKELKPFLKKDKTILIDGEDHVKPRLGAGGYLYFKRELIPKIWYYSSYKMIPRFVYSRLPLPKRIHPIAFAIPKEKITSGVGLSSKESLFPLHIVDEEVRKSNLVPQGAGTTYQFESEGDYFQNLRDSKFGITTKRGGWDCLRHYEIAANGSVMCFRDLDSKPTHCAPHGINMTNSIIYNSVDDLKRKIDKLSDSEYERILEQSYRWIHQQTSENRAKEILDVAKSYLIK